jgi:hypothetical protein
MVLGSLVLINGEYIYFGMAVVLTELHQVDADFVLYFV